jgi:serine protease Do
MKKISHILVAVFFCLLAMPSWAAQTKIAPVSQEQVMLSYAPVVKKVAPAVVNIYTRKRVQQRAMSLFDDPFFQNFFGGMMPQGQFRERLESSLGSGVIVKDSGLVVTSHHVIDGAEEITVVLSDKREFEAELAAADEKSDLALLKIKTKGEKLPYLEIKDSDQVEVGDIVLAIGNPFGVGQTVTSGIVSAQARTSLDISDINYFIQTDAAINPGNSGGALVTMDGKLIGINSAIFSRSGGSMGLGFAVPSNMVRAIVGGAERGQKKLVRPWLGIKGQAVTSDMATSLGMKRPMGLLVNGLHKGSPAGQAGIRVGDVITHVNGREIEDPESFSYRLATLALGGDAEMMFLRGGKEEVKKVRLIAPPEIPAREETLLDGNNPFAGATVGNLSPAVGEEYGLFSDEDGVVILSTQRGSPASRFGFAKGDVIVRINAEDVSSVKQLRKIIGKKTEGWHISLKRGTDMVRLIVGR